MQAKMFLQVREIVVSVLARCRGMLKSIMPALPVKVFTAFAEFIALPDARDAGHLELRDGVIGHLTGEPWWHLDLRIHLRGLFRPAADEHGMLAFEWMPYRPAQELQCWYATALG